MGSEKRVSRCASKYIRTILSRIYNVDGELRVYTYVRLPDTGKTVLIQLSFTLTQSPADASGKCELSGLALSVFGSFRTFEA